MSLKVRSAYKPLVLQAARIQAERRERLRAAVQQHKAEQDSLEAFIPQVFVTRGGGPAYPPRHIREQFIPALEDDSLGNTVIIAPPGSAKTMTSMAACAWWLGRNPNQHVGYFSGTNNQAQDRSVAIRDLMVQSAAYGAIFPDVQPDRSKGWGERAWFLWRPDRADKDPTMLATGTGTAIQGARIDRGLLDDVASRQMMATAYQRQKVLDWLQQDVLSRGTPGARWVMICTRWHEEDPAAWAIRQGWHVVFIDALDEEGETYWPEYWRQEMLSCPGGRHGYAIGYRRGPDGQTICWEDRDPETGDIIRAGQCAHLENGTRNFNLIWRGITAADETALFKRGWWRYYRDLPIAIRDMLGEALDEDEEAELETGRRRPKGGIFVDLAHEEGKKNDYTVIAPWATDGVNFYLLDLWRQKREFPEVLDAVVKMRERYPLPIYIESTPGSKPLIQVLRRRLPSVHPWSIGGKDKMARAESIIDLPEAGNVYLPQWAAWLKDWIEEHAQFGQGAEHDDQVDTTTMALIRLGKKRGLRVV